MDAIPRQPRLRLPALVLALAAVLSLPLTLPAQAELDSVARMVQMTNETRIEAGQPPLTRADDLEAVARAHAARMAEQQDLHHNPSLGGEIAEYRRAGENVGRGRSLGAIHRELVDSPGHYRNLVDAEFTEVGVAVHERDGTRWVVQVFRQPVAD